MHAAAPTEVSTLSLHDALPICGAGGHRVAGDDEAEHAEAGGQQRRGPAQEAFFQPAVLRVEVIRRVQPLEVSTGGGHRQDRKSTRLNSSHVAISYAVFCLKKKI